MFIRRKFSFLLPFLVNIVAILAKPKMLKYDMNCKCGMRKIDEDSEKDCEESARLESSDQEFKIRYFILCFTDSKAVQFNLMSFSIKLLISHNRPEMGSMRGCDHCEE